MLKFSYACASDSFNTFDVDISFNTTVFDANNIFTLELSDNTGSFSNPTTLKTISDKNLAFNFTTSFQIPLNTHGTGYKLRVKASSPQRISPESDVFEAYYTTSDQLILNNFTDVVLCDGDSKELTLNINTAENYQWYKDGIKYFFGGPSLTVTEPGLYYSEIYYGSCTSSAISNIVEVTKLAPVDASLKGNALVEVCVGDSYTLEANVQNLAYSYSWYKDGVKITSLPAYSPTYTINDSSQFGNYTLEIETDNSCTGTSSEVVVKAAETNVVVSASSNLSFFILQGETKTLSIEHNAVNGTIEWFKNGVAIQSSNTKEIQVNEAGVYVARVTFTEGSCTYEKSSPEFNIFGLKAIDGTISTQNGFTNCQSTEANITVSDVAITDTNDQTHQLTTTQIDNLNYQWYLEGVEIAGATSKTLLVNDFNTNGNYHVKLSSANITSDSNVLEIKLALPAITVSSTSTGNVICNGQAITLETPVVTGYSYQWYKNSISIASTTTNSLEVIEAGNYKVEVTAFGCIATSEEIVISSFDESTVQLDSDLAFSLNQGETRTITASGADVYVWIDEQNVVLSNSSTVTINKEGIYTLTAKVGTCEVQKTITVTEIGTSVVPNLVTLNGDGINDVWALSNIYARNSSVTVEIYNSRGDLVFKTNNYQNDWPNDSSITRSQLFYYIIKNENELLKKGTISVLK